MRVLPLPCVVTLRELFSCSSCIETLVYEHVFFDLYLGFFTQLREEIRQVKVPSLSYSVLGPSSKGRRQYIHSFRSILFMIEKRCSDRGYKRQKKSACGHPGASHAFDYLYL